MDINEAASLARRHMNANGLGHVSFEFDRGRNRLGSAQFNRATKQPVKITLSKHYTAILPKDEIEEVILHEIAHVLAGWGAHHGPQWKRVARSLGIKGDRCATPSATPEGRVKGYCPVCEKVVTTQHRLPLRVKWHAGCGSKKRVLRWFKDGKVVPFRDMPERYQHEARSMV